MFPTRKNQEQSSSYMCQLEYFVTLVNFNSYGNAVVSYSFTKSFQAHILFVRNFFNRNTELYMEPLFAPAFAFLLGNGFPDDDDDVPSSCYKL